MELTFIDNEITEAKLYRHSRKFSSITGREIANLVYLQTLCLYLLSKQSDTDKIARGYAHQTAQYGTYALFRTHATDLYMLCYAVLHPYSNNVELKEPIKSKQFLEQCKLNSKQHITYCRQMADGSLQDSRITTYFYRLEAQLKIEDGRYKQWRRIISNWPNANKNLQDKIKKQLVMEMRRMANGVVRGSELFPIINKSVAGKPRRKQLDMPQVARSVAGSSAGATASRYTASRSIRDVADFWKNK